MGYAPMVNDGIVAYPSAALSTCCMPPQSASEDVLSKEHVIDGAEAASSWCDPQLGSFLDADTPQVAQKVREAALALLKAGTWTIVDVQMNQRDMAGLYPETRDG